jgi:hypothetical protein
MRSSLQNQSPPLFIIFILLLCVVSCSSDHTGNTKLEPAAISYIDEQDGWKKVGVSLQGQLMSELDLKSIKKIAPNKIEFREKRTVLDSGKKNVSNNLPKHQYSINTWVIDCAKKTYQLVRVALFNERKEIISQGQYTEQDIQPMAIVAGSISAQHLKHVC